MAETGKKGKAPAKPRAATAEKTAAPKKTATKKAAKAAKTAAVSTNGPVRRPSHEEIAKLAQQYWAERGHADGHAEQDWLRAEQELTKKAS